jgi:hypothetical protein
MTDQALRETTRGDNLAFSGHINLFVKDGELGLGGSIALWDHKTDFSQHPSERRQIEGDAGASVQLRHSDFPQADNGLGRKE